MEKRTYRTTAVTFALIGMFIGSIAIQVQASNHVELTGRAYVPFLWHQGYMTWYPWCTVDISDEAGNQVAEVQTNWYGYYSCNVPGNHTYTVQAHSNTPLDVHYSQPISIWAPRTLPWWWWNMTDIYRLPTLYCW